MEPLTTIIGAILAGIAAASKPVTEQAVKDAYFGLKSIIQSKFGNDSEVVDAIQRLERKPESAGRQETLKEELEDISADQDKEIVQAAEKLFDLLERTSDGGQHIQQAIGNYIAQADRGSSATVTVTQSPSKKD